MGHGTFKAENGPFPSPPPDPEASTSGSWGAGLLDRLTRLWRLESRRFRCFLPNLSAGARRFSIWDVEATELKDRGSHVTVSRLRQILSG